MTRADSIQFELLLREINDGIRYRLREYMPKWDDKVCDSNHIPVEGDRGKGMQRIFRTV